MEFLRKFYSHGIPAEVIIECPDEVLQSGKKYPTVILCHGHSRHKNDGLDVLSHMLVREGFLVFRHDFRGCGDKAVNKYQLYCATEWPSDLINLINYVESLGCTDTEKLGVAGISMGACTTVYVSGIDKRIKSLVSMSGIGDCYSWMQYVWKTMGGDFEEFKKSVNEAARFAAATGEVEIRNVLDMYHFPDKDREDKILEPFAFPGNCEYIAWDTMQELLMYKPLEKCPSITQPVFFLTGEEDVLVPHEQTEKMYEAVASKVKKKKDYKGVEHNIPMDPQRELAFADICTWFKETL